MGWSIKKPLGSKNSIANQIVSHPQNLLYGGPVAVGLEDMHRSNMQASADARAKKANANQAAMASEDALTQLANEEEAKRKALGVQQQGQINAFADQTAASGKSFRDSLASSLSRTASDRFNQLNPSILEDLNSRGLFTSQTARDKSQADALKSISLQDQGILQGVDQNNFNNVQDLRGSALSSLLGGDQSALDSALSLRKASIQHQFDQQSQQSQMNLAQDLADKQRRQQLLSSIIGLGGQLGAGALTGGFL